MNEPTCDSIVVHFTKRCHHVIVDTLSPLLVGERLKEKTKHGTLITESWYLAQLQRNYVEDSQRQREILSLLPCGSSPSFLVFSSLSTFGSYKLTS